jgi:hypothetical protein
MPSKPTPEDRDTDAGRDFGDTERSVLYLLTDPDNYPTIWSIPDLGREIDYFDPESVVYRLTTAGLAYKTGDGFVFATPAAWRMVQMVGHVD